MPAKSLDSHTDVLVEFLSEFANHLLACGISMSEFRSAAQVAFVQAALGSARLQNSRVIQSGIAAVTGLSRPQVRALLRGSPVSPPAISARMNAVISGWRTDPEFTDEDGKPRSLSTSTGRTGFPALVKKYGRDVSHPALLSELQRVGWVSQIGRSVLLRDTAKNSKQSEMTRLLSLGLTHIIRKEPSGVSGLLHVVTGEATYFASDSTSRALLRRRVVQGTRAFTADLQAAGDAIASRRPKKTGLRKLSTRVLVVTVD
jgi:Family of unknown function (DUF6502)